MLIENRIERPTPSLALLSIPLCVTLLSLPLPLPFSRFWMTTPLVSCYQGGFHLCNVFPFVYLSGLLALIHQKKTTFLSSSNTYIFPVKSHPPSPIPPLAIGMRSPDRSSSPMDNFPTDPLLKQGYFIDLDDSNFTDPTPVPPEPSTPVHYSSGAGAGATSDAAPRSDPPSANADSEVPDWLPPGWLVDFRVRSSGATAGHRDKYYYCADSKRRFRSKKEVMSFLETGEVSRKKKGDGPDGETTKTSTPKRKKAAAAPRASVDNFKFNDVPTKVKWVLTDAYEGLWTPLVNGADPVSETEKQDWAAAYRYLSLHKSSNGTTGGHT